MSACTLNINVTRNGDSIAIDVMLDAPGLEIPHLSPQYNGDTVTISYYSDPAGPVADHIPNIPLNGAAYVEVEVVDKDTRAKKCDIRKHV
ncbi:MAG: hypothetical protein JXQ87_09050 [Bacteroidia bacterium]